MKAKSKEFLKLFVAVAIVKGLYIVYAKHSYEDEQTQRMISRIENVTAGTDTAIMAAFITETKEIMLTEKQSKDKEFQDAVKRLIERYEYLKTLPPDSLSQRTKREREVKKINMLELGMDKKPGK